MQTFSLTFLQFGKKLNIKIYEVIIYFPHKYCYKHVNKQKRYNCIMIKNLSCLKISIISIISMFFGRNIYRFQYNIIFFLKKKVNVISFYLYFYLHLYKLEISSFSLSSTFNSWITRPIYEYRQHLISWIMMSLLIQTKAHE